MDGGESFLGQALTTPRRYGLCPSLKSRQGTQQVHMTSGAAENRPRGGRGLSVAGGQGAAARAGRAAGGASLCAGQARTPPQNLRRDQAGLGGHETKGCALSPCVYISVRSCLCMCTCLCMCIGRTHVLHVCLHVCEYTCVHRRVAHACGWGTCRLGLRAPCRGL